MTSRSGIFLGSYPSWARSRYNVDSNATFSMQCHEARSVDSTPCGATDRSLHVNTLLMAYCWEPRPPSVSLSNLEGKGAFGIVLVMDDINAATNDFILGPWPNAKRSREETCKGPADLGKNSLSTKCSLLPKKKFAGGIHFPTTQDLNFEPIVFSQEIENFTHQFSEHPGNLLLGSEQKKFKAMPSSFKKEHLQIATKQGDIKTANPDPKRCEQAKITEKLAQNIEIDTSDNSSSQGRGVTNQLHFNDPIMIVSENLDSAQQIEQTTRPKGIAPSPIAPSPLVKPAKENGNLSSSLKLQLELKEQNATLDVTTSTRNLDHAPSSCNTEPMLSPSVPSLKAKVAVRNPIQYRMTKLEAINENEVVKHRLSSNLDTEPSREISSETVDDSTHKEKQDEVIVFKKSGELSTKAPVVPYDKKKVPDLMDAEWELCTQWLNKDRSQTLQQLKDRSERAKSTESALCYELEKMLVNTREILEKELEFSVRLCSMRGQCLLFQETIRLNNVL